MPEQPENPGKPEKPEKPVQATCRMTLAAVPAAVRAARAFVGMTLRAWQLEVLTEQAELVVSELATNAVRATDNSGSGSGSGSGSEACGAGLFALPSLTVQVQVRPDSVRVAVRDSIRDLPVLRQPATDAEGGRGLLLVKLLSVRWGVHHLGGGDKVVWADLTNGLTAGREDGRADGPADGRTTGSPVSSTDGPITARTTGPMTGPAAGRTDGRRAPAVGTGAGTGAGTGDRG